MQVEIDRKAYAIKRQVPIAVSQNRESQQIARIRIVGLTDGENVYLVPNIPRNLFVKLFHEFGHAYGTLVSFQFGPIISYKEAKQAAIHLSPDEIEFLKKYIHSESEVIAVGQVLSIAEKIINIITRSDPETKKVKIHAVSQAHMDELTQNILSTVVSPKGITYYQNSRAGRNKEAEAYFFQIVASKVLENTIRAYRIDPNFEYSFDIPEAPYHRRAIGIAARFYLSGKKVPSTVDRLARG